MGDTILMDRQTIGATEEKELVADSADASILVDAALSEGRWFLERSGTAHDSGNGRRPKKEGERFRLGLGHAHGGRPLGRGACCGHGLSSGSGRRLPAELFRAGNFAHEISVEQLERAVKDASLSPFPSIPGKRSAQLSFTTELRGSGAPGVAPDYGLLFKACAMKETIVEDASVAYKPASDKSSYTRICPDGVHGRLTSHVSGLHG